MCGTGISVPSGVGVTSNPLKDQPMIDMITSWYFWIGCAVGGISMLAGLFLVANLDADYPDIEEIENAHWKPRTGGKGE